MKYLTIIMLSLGLLGGAVNARAQDEAPPCSSPEHHQFDFWLGEWDLTWGEGDRGGNTITRILDDCIIQENFDGGDSMPLRGMSFSAYNAATGAWQQTWVDNTGTYLDFHGGMAGDRMILERSVTRDGKVYLQRMIFRNIKPDSLDWDWQLSADEGKTWTDNWQIHYQRRKL